MKNNKVLIFIGVMTYFNPSYIKRKVYHKQVVGNQNFQSKH